MERCYVCGREGAEVRHSYRWKQRVCTDCLWATAGDPVGLTCEVRASNGRLCRKPASATRVCRRHERLAPWAPTAIALERRMYLAVHTFAEQRLEALHAA